MKKRFKFLVNEEQLANIIITTLRNKRIIADKPMVMKLVEITLAQLWGHRLLGVHPTIQQVVDAMKVAFERLGIRS